MQDCLLPWVNLFYHTNGKVYPCCKLGGNPEFEVGSSLQPVSQLQNASVLRDMRVQIKNGALPPACVRHCVSGIQPLNILLPTEFKKNKQTYYSDTAEDGSVTIPLQTCNIDESNLCNFKCVYCSKEHSTKFDGILRKAFPSTDEMLKLLTPVLDSVKLLILAGGESHMQKGYYQLLEHLIAIGRTDIGVQFVTNMSGYTFQGRNLYKLLNQFSNATIIGSLDASGKRAEFIRRGTVWEHIIANRRYLQQFPNIKFVLQPVVSNLSVFSLFDFHREWVERGFVEKQNVRLFCLTHPKELGVNVLPVEVKEKVKVKLDLYKQWVKESLDAELNGVTLSRKISSISHWVDQPSEVSIKHLWEFISPLRSTLTCEFEDIFTEFKTVVP